MLQVSLGNQPNATLRTRQPEPDPAANHTATARARRDPVRKPALPRLRAPVLAAEKAKYSAARGMFKVASICPAGFTPDANLAVQGAISATVGALNASLAQSTWDKYDTVVRHLRCCELATGVSMVLPLQTLRSAKMHLCYISSGQSECLWVNA